VPTVMLAAKDRTGMGQGDAEARIFEPVFTTRRRARKRARNSSNGLRNRAAGRRNIGSTARPGIGKRLHGLYARIEARLRGSLPQGRPTTCGGGDDPCSSRMRSKCVRSRSCILERHGYNVIRGEQTAGEASLVCEQHASFIHLLLSAVVMAEA